MNNVNWEAVGIFLVLVGMIANLAVLVIGRPKSLQALKEGQDQTDAVDITIRHINVNVSKL